MITRRGIAGSHRGMWQQSSVRASAPSLVGSDGSNELLPSAITWLRCLTGRLPPPLGRIPRCPSSLLRLGVAGQQSAGAAFGARRAREEEASKQIDVACIH